MNRIPDDILAIHVCLALLRQMWEECHRHPCRTATSSCHIERPPPFFFQHPMHLYVVVMAHDPAVLLAGLHLLKPFLSGRHLASSGPTDISNSNSNSSTRSTLCQVRAPTLNKSWSPKREWLHCRCLWVEPGPSISDCRTHQISVPNY